MCIRLMLTINHVFVVSHACCVACQVEVLIHLTIVVDRQKNVSVNFFSTNISQNENIFLLHTFVCEYQNIQQKNDYLVNCFFTPFG